MKMRAIFMMIIFLAGLAITRHGLASGDVSPYAKLDQLPLNQVEVRGGFWGEKREQLWKEVLPYQWTQLEANHDVDNFRVVAGEKPGTQFGPVYLDSDLYKWLEAASYMAGRHSDDKWLSDRVVELTGLIQKAQMPDGYINTYYQSFAPDRRWTNLVMNHELYCSGHLIEAACANREATGKDALFNAAKKLADHIVATFGPGKNEGVPGHEEVELALVRLYRQTGDKKYLEQASWFINQRGRYNKYPKAWIASLKDQASLSETANAKRAQFQKFDPKTGTAAGHVIINLDPRIPMEFLNGSCFQDDKPFLDQTVGVGHAVRAMYYFTGAADVFLETGDAKLLQTSEKIWDNTIGKRTYITGGMGSLGTIEGFGRDYELPNRSYTETCAAIGSFFWNWRLLRATAEPKYGDLMEKTLYNAILPAIALDGKNYFYQNPLTSSKKDKRQPWYGTACCPPNIARLFGSLERYLYAQSAEGIWVNQYVSGVASFARPEGKIALEIESGFPWAGNVKLKLSPQKPAAFALVLRIPSWADNAAVKINGKSISEKAVPGTFLKLDREWKPGDEVEIYFPMTPRLVDSPVEVKENQGKVAILAGPLIYCLEDQDNPEIYIHKVVIARSAKLETEKRNDLLSGVNVVKGKTADGKQFIAIPYYSWSNRGPSNMDIWLKVR